MGRRNKQPEKVMTSTTGVGDAVIMHHQGRAPAKQPTLLAVSLVLFALWFVFLLITALTG